MVALEKVCVLSVVAYTCVRYRHAYHCTSSRDTCTVRRAVVTEMLN